MNISIEHYSKIPFINSNSIIKLMQDQQNSKKLYGQFLLYMKSHHKHNDKPVQMMYKQLHSQLHKKNQDKRKIILTRLTSKQKFMKSRSAIRSVKSISPSFTPSQKQLFSRTAKFKKIQGFEQYQSMKGVMLKKDCLVFDPILSSEINDKILMQQAQKGQLQTQIAECKKLISGASKKIRGIKLDIKQIESKQKKFQQAYHLANNMNQYTRQISSQNTRNYQKMLGDQQAVLSELKKMNSSNKKQLEQTLMQYQNLQKEHQAKFIKVINATQPLEQFYQQSALWKPQKGIKQLLESISSLLVMFQENQATYEEVKLIYCTKVHKKGIMKDYLSAEKLDWINSIEQFEEKFGLRVQSSVHLMSQFYKQLKQQNQSLQKRILEQELIREDYEQEYLRLQRKSLGYSQGKQIESSKQKELKSQENDKIKWINSNSKVCIGTVELINSLLIKFRYVYRVYLVIKIGKNKIGSHLTNIESALDKKKYFGDSRRAENDYDNINSAQMYEIMVNMFPSLEKQLLKDLLFMLFNDIRTPIFCRKNTIVEQLHFCKNQSWEALAKAFKSIREEAQHIFIQKFKNMITVLQECIKEMPKSKPLPSERTIFQPNFLNKVFIDNRAFNISVSPKVKLHHATIQEDKDKVESNGQGKQINDSTIQQNHENIGKWSDSAKKNPSRMLRQLRNLWNQNCNKFKIIDLHVNRNAYQPRNFFVSKSKCVNESVVKNKLRN